MDHLADEPAALEAAAASVWAALAVNQVRVPSLSTWSRRRRYEIVVLVIAPWTDDEGGASPLPGVVEILWARVEGGKRHGRLFRRSRTALA